MTTDLPIRRNDRITCCAVLLALGLLLSSVLLAGTAAERTLSRIELADGTIVEEVAAESPLHRIDANNQGSSGFALTRELKVTAPGQATVIRESITLPVEDVEERTILGYGETQTFFVVVYKSGEGIYARAKPLREAPRSTTRPNDLQGNPFEAIHRSSPSFDRRLPADTETVSIVNEGGRLTLTCLPSTKRLVYSYDAERIEVE